MKYIDRYKHNIAKYTIRGLFSVGLPVVVLWYLFSKIRLEDFYITVKNVSVPWLLLGFVTYGANQVFRTIRFFCLTHSARLNMFQLFRVQSIYIFLNYLLPFRTGEISYIYLANSYQNISVANCISSLIVARVSDYALLILCYIFIAFQMDLNLPLWFDVIINSSVICLLLLFFMFVGYILLKKNHYVRELAEKIRTYPFLKTNNLIKKIGGQAKKILISFEEIGNFKVLIQVTLTTIATWICVISTFYIIVRSLGYSVNSWQIVLITVVATMSRLFQGVANLGSHEIGWLGGLLLIGFSDKDAGLVSVSSHMIILSYMLFITLYSRLTLKSVTAVD